jgi:hypothetical protein
MADRRNLEHSHFWPVGLERGGTPTPGFEKFFNRAYDLSAPMTPLFTLRG